MASAGCRYEVDLYIFFENVVAVFLLHTEKISALRCFLITKQVGDVLLIITDWKHRDVSNAILYKLLFFSGIPDHDSVKLCFSRSQLFLIYFSLFHLLQKEVISDYSWIYTRLQNLMYCCAKTRCRDSFRLLY